MHQADPHNFGDQRPKLLVLSSTYPRWKNDHEPGFVHELNRRLISRFRVTVLCPHAPGAQSVEEMDGITIIRYRYAPSKLETLVNDGGLVGNLKECPWKAFLLPTFFLGQVIALIRVLRALKPHVIHAHWLIPQGLCVCLSQLMSDRKVPFLVTSHGADLFALKGRLFYSVKRFVLSRSSAITVVSRVMKTKLKIFGIPGNKVSVQPMGVELGGSFKPNLSVKSDLDELLFVGRLVEKKGLRYLLSAMPQIIAQHPTCKLRIVGFGPDEQALKEQAADLGLEQHVRFDGAVPNRDLPHYYQHASVFVAPFVQAENGDQEGLGLVLVEAMGCGCPAVVSDLPAIQDVTDGLEGVITVPQKQVSAIADAVSRVLNDLDRFRSNAVSSGQLIKERFDWDGVAERYSRILLALVSEDPLK